MIKDIPKKFKLITVPRKANFYRVPFYKISNTFKKNAIEVKNINNKKYITFKRQIDFDQEYVKDYIKEKYKEKYKNIIIKNIQLQSFSYINIKGYFIENIKLSNNAINQEKSSVKIFFSKKQKNKNKLNKKSIFFRYSIEALLPSIKASRDIQRGDKITIRNTVNAKAGISDYKKSIKQIDFKNSYAKYNIKMGSLIKYNHIKKKHLITRGDLIIAMYKVGSIQAQRNAKALQSGYLGDWIIIEINKEKKRAKIISDNKVEIK